MLKTLHAKPNTDAGVIKKLMELTWERRHHDIITNPADVLVLLERYPYLGEKDYVSLASICRLINNIYTYICWLFYLGNTSVYINV